MQIFPLQWQPRELYGAISFNTKSLSVHSLEGMCNLEFYWEGREGPGSEGEKRSEKAAPPAPQVKDSPDFDMYGMQTT